MVMNKMLKMENIDWKNLPFGYFKTDYNVRSHYKDGQWSTPRETTSETFDIHIAATCLHYGQEAFEGLKAFRGKDGKIRIFRLRENALRMQSSCRGIAMAELPVDIFEEAVLKAVKLNEKYVPPYESGASLYIRPLLIGTSAQVGVKPAKEFLFIVFVNPVGPYFKTGFTPTALAIFRQYDRAAPQGTGCYKIGGNYAAGLVAGEKAHEMGYSAVLYLDPKEKKYVDEGGPANFFAIKGNSYITPLSPSILPSITNDSLIRLAADMGMNVERRQISVDELESFEEVGICGTAAVISPVERIDDIDENKSFVFGTDKKAGPVSTRLYHNLKAIQYGDEPDPYGWITLL